MRNLKLITTIFLAISLTACALTKPRSEPVAAGCAEQWTLPQGTTEDYQTDVKLLKMKNWYDSHTKQTIPVSPATSNSK